ncbi:hypothetical protein B0H16DRAFT_1696129 [Mycena metata]|uniref:Uncharacterized protein n=1 Tax=Mycena metata TaxID=1033252 RepID=A0AAD7I375_9AGAR|nr:hypothetical protein B0H16DRAFT_1696129 [Mycena metata]
MSHVSTCHGYPRARPSSTICLSPRQSYFSVERVAVKFYILPLLCTVQMMICLPTVHVEENSTQLRGRVSEYDANAEGLAWRAFDILDAILNVSGGGVGPVSPAMLDAIETLVRLLHEISAAMQRELELGRLNMQSRHSPLPQFIARLDVIFEVFKDVAHLWYDNLPVSGGRGGIAGGAGGLGSGPRFQAETIMMQNCSPDHERLEQSYVRITHPRADLGAYFSPRQICLDTELRVLHTEMRGLHIEVRVLRTVVLFVLSPISRGYPSGCAGAL